MSVNSRQAVNYLALLHSLLANDSTPQISKPGVWHFGSRDMTVAAMLVLHVLTTCVVFFCTCCTEEYFHVAISAKIIY